MKKVTSEGVNKLDPKVLRHNFISYLKTHYQYARPEIMASNVFYAYHNNIGMEFLSIFADDKNMTDAKDLLERKFVQVGRKNPRAHANVHYGCWQKFKEFVDNVYGSVENLE